jgi:transcriptional regulator GlxA family with amidase domain
MSRPSHIPTDFERHLATTLAGFGLSTEQLATALQLNPRTLLKHFRDEIALGSTKFMARRVNEATRRMPAAQE